MGTYKRALPFVAGKKCCALCAAPGTRVWCTLLPLLGTITLYFNPGGNHANVLTGGMRGGFIPFSFFHKDFCVRTTTDGAPLGAIDPLRVPCFVEFTPRGRPMRSVFIPMVVPKETNKAAIDGAGVVPEKSSEFSGPCPAFTRLCSPAHF